MYTGAHIGNLPPFREQVVLAEQRTMQDAKLPIINQPDIDLGIDALAWGPSAPSDPQSQEFESWIDNLEKLICI